MEEEHLPNLVNSVQTQPRLRKRKMLIMVKNIDCWPPWVQQHLKHLIGQQYFYQSSGGPLERVYTPTYLRLTGHFSPSATREYNN